MTILNVLMGAGGGSSHSLLYNNTLIACGHGKTPFISIYKKNETVLTKLANPSNLPTGQVAGVAFSPTGTYMACAHVTSPYVTIYKRSGEVFTKLANPGTLPTGNSNAVSWSKDETYLAVAHAVSPFLTIYKRSGDTFTKLANPSNLPTGNGLAVSFSNNGLYLAVGHSNTPFLTIYKRSGDTFTKLSTLDNLPPAYLRNMTWSYDDMYVGGGMPSTYPGISLYQRTDDNFVSCSGSYLGNYNAIVFKPNSHDFLFSSKILSFLTQFRVSNNTYTRVGDWGGGGVDYTSVACSMDGKIATTTLSTAPRLFVFTKDIDGNYVTTAVTLSVAVPGTALSTDIFQY